MAPSLANGDAFDRAIILTCIVAITVSGLLNNLYGDQRSSADENVPIWSTMASLVMIVSFFIALQDGPKLMPMVKLDEVGSDGDEGGDADDDDRESADEDGSISDDSLSEPETTTLVRNGEDMQLRRRKRL